MINAITYGNVFAATSYVYDTRGRIIAATDALGGIVHTAYDDLGNVTAQWGATYPVAYTYDTVGRKTSMRTFRDEPGGTDAPPATGGDLTQWLYEHATGLCTNKIYADGSSVSYTFTPDGKPLRTTWARNVWKENSYDALGQLTGITYSDNTPPVSFAYDRLGRMVSAVSAVSTNLFAYSPSTLQLLSETQNGAVFTRHTDSLGRESGLSLGQDDWVTYGYDDAGRFSSVSSSVFSVSSVVNYAYLPGSSLLAGYTSGGFTRSVAYEPSRDLITAVSNLWGASVISAYGYASDAIGRRISRTDSGLALAQTQSNAFGYNDRSEVTSALMHTNAYGYVFDPIGNRLVSSHNAETSTYAANSLNQYTAISTSASSAPPREPTYDADGNMLSDGSGWFYAWNAENRMILASNAAHTVTYAYDHQGRMVWKKIFDLITNHWSPTTNVNYLWDGYNIIVEQVIANGATSTAYNIWGLDLSGSMQGAGGVGGLLAVHKNGTVFLPAYDANGNITEYVDASGNVRAHYEYDAFGSITAQFGDLADTFTHRFSTKPWCPVTGLSEYEQRKYKADIGCWGSRDPIGERGGLNLYAFCDNDGLNDVDPFGERSLSGIGSDIKSWASSHLTGRGGISRTLPPLRFMVHAPPPVWLEANVTFSGEAFNCLHPATGKTVVAIEGSVTVDGFVAVGVSLVKGDPGKGRKRNERIPNPNNPGQTVKRKKAPGEPASGFRERRAYGDVTASSDCQKCPREGWAGIDGAVFLRGSAGIGWGYQFNFQKSITDHFTDLTQGWSASAGAAMGLTGMSLEAGISVSGSLVGYIK